jgi:hypothetical protein
VCVTLGVGSWNVFSFFVCWTCRATDIEFKASVVAMTTCTSVSTAALLTSGAWQYSHVLTIALTIKWRLKNFIHRSILTKVT